MDRLARWLESTDTTQIVLAEKVGVSQPTISDWLNGRTTPTVENLRRLSTITGLSIDEILETRAA